VPLVGLTTIDPAADDGDGRVLSHEYLLMGTLVVLDVVGFQIHAVDNSHGGLFAVFSSGIQIQPMRKSTNDLIWDFIVLCDERSGQETTGIRGVHRSRL
jgi:hypothetical protein